METQPVYKQKLAAAASLRFPPQKAARNVSGNVRFLNFYFFVEFLPNYQFKIKLEQVIY
jgi:hypothetical protein